MTTARLRAGVSGALAVLVLSACTAVGGTSAPAAGTDADGAVGAASAETRERPDGLATEATSVVLSEMAVATPSPWEAGEQVLHVRNAGGAHHNLIICPGDETGCDEGGGVPMDLLVKPEVRDPAVIPDRTSSLVLGAGADAVVRVDALDPGSYVLWCAIPNHAARGMQQVIEVGSEVG